MTAEERYAIYSNGVQKEIEKIAKNNEKYKDEQYGIDSRLYGEIIDVGDELPMAGI